MPAPPRPPEHSVRTFPVIWLFVISGEPKLTLIPTPSQPRLDVMMLKSMVGEAFDTTTPLPEKPPPLVMVNPAMTAPRPSPALKVTTAPPAAPSMMVPGGHDKCGSQLGQAAAAGDRSQRLLAGVQEGAQRDATLMG